MAPRPSSRRHGAKRWRLCSTLSWKWCVVVVFSLCATPRCSHAVVDGDNRSRGAQPEGDAKSDGSRQRGRRGRGTTHISAASGAKKKPKSSLKGKGASRLLTSPAVTFVPAMSTGISLPQGPGVRTSGVGGNKSPMRKKSPRRGGGESETKERGGESKSAAPPASPTRPAKRRPPVAQRPSPRPSSPREQTRASTRQSLGSSRAPSSSLDQTRGPSPLRQVRGIATGKGRTHASHRPARVSSRRPRAHVQIQSIAFRPSATRGTRPRRTSAQNRCCGSSPSSQATRCRAPEVAGVSLVTLQRNRVERGLRRRTSPGAPSTAPCRPPHAPRLVGALLQPARPALAGSGRSQQPRSVRVFGSGTGLVKNSLRSHGEPKRGSVA